MLTNSHILFSKTWLIWNKRIQRSKESLRTLTPRPHRIEVPPSDCVPWLPLKAFIRVLMSREDQCLDGKATKPANPSLRPGIHMLERKAWLLQVVLWLLHDTVNNNVINYETNTRGQSSKLFLWFSWKDWCIKVLVPLHSNLSVKQLESKEQIICRRLCKSPEDSFPTRGAMWRLRVDNGDPTFSSISWYTFKAIFLL